MASVEAGELLKESSERINAAAAEGELEEERAWTLRIAMVMTPSAMRAAAPIATIAEMLRMIFLWCTLVEEIAGLEPESSEGELGLRTIGFGRTEGQERLTEEPQRSGLPERHDGGMTLKKFPEGMGPER